MDSGSVPSWTVLLLSFLNRRTLPPLLMDSRYRVITGRLNVDLCTGNVRPVPPATPVMTCRISSRLFHELYKNSGHRYGAGAFGNVIAKRDEESGIVYAAKTYMTVCSNNIKCVNNNCDSCMRHNRDAWRDEVRIHNLLYKRCGKQLLCMPLMRSFDVVDNIGKHEFINMFWPAHIDLRQLMERMPLKAIHVKFIAYWMFYLLRVLHEDAHLAYFDMKVDNIVMVGTQFTEHEGGPAFMFCDIGSIKSVEFNDPYCVTRWYRPPEVFFRSPFSGMSLDMWCAGVTLLELWRRDHPFKGSSPMRVIRKIVQYIGVPPLDVMQASMPYDPKKHGRNLQVPTHWFAPLGSPPEDHTGDDATGYETQPSRNNMSAPFKQNTAGEVVVNRFYLYGGERVVDRRFDNFDIPSPTPSNSYLDMDDPNGQAHIHFVNLLEHLVKWCPHRRFTAGQAIEHPFCATFYKTNEK
jgi:serine/threonine protein kinase